MYPHKNLSTQEIKPIHSVEINTLIVIDGTWRQANQIFNQIEILRTLPLYTLPTNITNQNPMRKPPSKHHLSTFESSLYAIEILDQRNYQSSLQALHKMNDRYKKFTKTNLT